ncbi:CBS domain-containing protein [Paraconexibacter algicola]|uniref:CBS domain-containing protein n=1 Tax=Paraconexibacter algicola TaxID=2133960 RepID=A0A2T4UL73_9ACTN|nr:CBS domain-containing protein [Paraconexibacter algicola]PTL59992.1 CBS domain-containing protein [Paraconexibacter algicola]
MATIARDVMTSDWTSVTTEDTAQIAARTLTSEGVGALPICSTDGRLVGVVTDRDIVTRLVAEGRDPAQCSLGEFVSDEVVTIGADDGIEEAIRTMIDHGVRRLPVIDGTELVGMVAQADLAREVDANSAGELLAGLSRD